ncbi:hypothetical protein PCASD_03553 [Puccinia coronata f. sp. avenae]|uniref:Uncharacterized protein n=1 Tax=Puccinia coronata f. sp. avenae TaxID=200324 RepID=A0A2N5VDF0_9BASI|nr:hypothetical protein PCASD_03553 [Puccinia coronata f. sp. avenae]
MAVSKSVKGQGRRRRREQRLKEASGTRTTTKRSNVPRKASQKIVVISDSEHDGIECLNDSEDNGIVCLNDHMDDEIECLDDSKDDGIECLNGHKDDKIERLNDLPFYYITCPCLHTCLWDVRNVEAQHHLARAQNIYFAGGAVPLYDVRNCSRHEKPLRVLARASNKCFTSSSRFTSLSRGGSFLLKKRPKPASNVDPNPNQPNT